MTTESSPSSRAQRATFVKRTAVFLAAIGGIGVGTFALGNAFYPTAKAENAALSSIRNVAAVTFDPSKPDSIRLVSLEKREELGLETAEVHAAGASEQLRLPGTLALDPSKFVRVNTRFSGEVVRLGTVRVNGEERQLQFGDRVQMGQLLAVIWSKDIGEKRSELTEAYARVEISKALLKRLEGLTKGLVTERQIEEARRQVDSDLIAVSKIERTLKSWRLSEDEIEKIRHEAQLLKGRDGAQDQALEKSWAETEVRAAMDGFLLEKNINVGDIVEHTDDIFKLVDLSRLRVVAHIYEEDLWTIRALGPSDRKWTLDLKSERNGNPIQGTFELIGNVIDPTARTGVLMGWVDNADDKFAIGQFLTATIHLPENRSEIAVPEKALIEEGDRSMLFVQDQNDPTSFSRRRVSVSRRAAGMVYLNADKVSKEADGVISCVAPGERVVVSGALGLGGEFEKLESLAAVRK